MTVGSTGIPSPPVDWKIHDAVLLTEDGREVPFYRCSGKLVCWDCWKVYSLHPSDKDAPELAVLCNGQRVKL